MTTIAINSEKRLAALIEETLAYEVFLNRRTLVELLYAIDPPVHEGRAPEYGAIISSNQDMDPPASCAPRSGLMYAVAYEDLTVPHTSSILDISPEDVSSARMLADGRTSFLAVRPDGSHQLALFDHGIDDELTLVSYAIKSQSHIVQRSSDGLVRVFTTQFTHYCRGRRWWSREHMDQNAISVRSSIPYGFGCHADGSALLSTQDQRVFDNILRFAYYWLSPACVGATLVWLLDDNPLKKLFPDGPPPGKRLSWANISVAQVASFERLRHLLGQLDRAVLFDRQGNLTAIDVQLTSTDKSREIVSEVGGTRHTSARRFSYDFSESVVVAVSADGPVTIFSDGGRVRGPGSIAFGIRSDGMEETRDPSHSSMEGIVHWRHPRCGRCDKTLALGVMDFPAPKSVYRVACPLCGNIVAEESCNGLEARLMKVLSPQ